MDEAVDMNQFHRGCGSVEIGKYSAERLSRQVHKRRSQTLAPTKGAVTHGFA
jgi:hypothetical protein